MTARLARAGTGAAVLALRSLLLMLLLGVAGGAEAHAVATITEPADGAVLPDPPAEVVIRFNEPVALTRAQVLGPDGEDVLAPGGGEAGEDGLHLALPEGLARGTYTVSYHVVSLDGHPIAGSLAFSIGAVSGAGGAVEEGTAAWRSSFIAARAALYLCLLGAVGGVAYGLLVRPGGSSSEGPRGVGARSALLGLGAAVVATGLQGGLLTGGPATLLTQPATWAAGLGSTFGCAALCAMAGLALVWAGSRLRSRTGDALALLGALLALASFGLSGHVVTAGPRGWTVPPLLIHAALAAFWAGSLVPLRRRLNASARESVPAVQRFSRLAVFAVPALILAGLVLTWIQVRGPEGLIRTDYGRVLLLKLALVGVLLALATLNRLSLTPALARGEAGAARWLRRSIGAEVGLVVLILAVTAALGATPPPRALLARAAPVDAHAREAQGHGHDVQHLALAAKDFAAEVTLAPGLTGRNELTVALRDPAGRPLEAPEVKLRLSNPEKGVAPLERPAERMGSGLWLVPELPLVVAGTWRVELDVLISDFERQEATAELTLR